MLRSSSYLLNYYVVRLEPRDFHLNYSVTTYFTTKRELERYELDYVAVLLAHHVPTGGRGDVMGDVRGGGM